MRSHAAIAVQLLRAKNIEQLAELSAGQLPFLKRAVGMPFVSPLEGKVVLARPVDVADTLHWDHSKEAGIGC